MWFLLVIALVAVAIAVPSTNWWRERRARRAGQEALDALLATSVEDIPDSIEFGSRFGSALADYTGREPTSDFILKLSGVAAEVFAEENFTVDGAPGPPRRYDSLDGHKYVEALRQQQRKLTERSTLEYFAQTLFESIYPLCESAPRASEGDVVFPVVLETALPDLPEVIHGMMFPYLKQPIDDFGVFAKLKAQLNQNLYDASGLRFPGKPDSADRLVSPQRYKGEQVAKTYLRGTPLLDALSSTTDFGIPKESRFEHMHVVAGTGHGKTQTLQHFILHDLNSDAGLVIIDSQGEMLRKVAQLRTDKELIYIDPTDVAHPPGLNMFDVSRLEGLPAVKREQFLNGLIELLEYVFAGLLRAELTQKQNVLFRYTLRLMLAVPGATLLDLLRCLAEPKQYLSHAKSLSPIAREFLEREFLDRSYAPTREQIRRRLYGVLENDAFRRMFSAPRNTIDVAAALNRGAVLLVDTAKSHLKADASALMGRYFIALTLQAALERDGNQRPAFLYIDEAGEYFDDNIDSLLNEARKRRVGIVMAHQYLDQLTPQLRSSIATNTSIKLAGGISDKDARTLASDMRTSSEMIAAQRKGHFMCYVKNVTPAAVSIEVPFGRLESLPKQPLRLASSISTPKKHHEDDHSHGVLEDVPADASEDTVDRDDAPEQSAAKVDLTPTCDW